MNKTTRSLWISLLVPAMFLLLVFLAMPLSVSAAGPEELRYSPLFEASLQDTLREFDEKESGLYAKQLNGAVTETASAPDTGDTEAATPEVVAYNVPGVPSVPKVPTTPSVPVPSYTSSYSCGSTCGSTCVGNSTCAGSSTCFGTSTCAGSSTCVGTSTCIGSSSCNSATCFGYSTCSGASTCNGTSTCTFGGVCVPITPSKPTGGSSGESSAGSSDPLPETPENDGLTPSSWAEAEVMEAIAEGFVPVELQKNYQSSITRKEFSQLMIQFLHAIVSTVPDGEALFDIDLGVSPFTDVDDPAVTWAYYLGIVSGVGNGMFNPDGSITRQEAAKMLSNMVSEVFDEAIGGNEVSFGDNGQMADWSRESVGFVCKQGIMNGVGDNNFAPLNTYTREQSIVTILRTYHFLLASE